MQPLLASPRSGLTTAQVLGLVRDWDGIIVGHGCELVDMSLSLVDDMSRWFGGGVVERKAYATLHGSAELVFSRSLNWDTALVRPYMTLSDGTVKARFNLGVYQTPTPQNVRMQDYTVQAHDILNVLNDLVGESYAVAAGASPLVEVEAILIDRGVQAYVIDQTQAGAVLPSARSWPITDDVTWLNIINDLLGSVGYLGIWSDWDGVMRCAPYTNPRERTAEWVYDTHRGTAMMAPDGTWSADWWQAPNRWVGVRSNNVDGPPPVEGDGIYTYQNDTMGRTSVSARGGRVVTAPIIRTDVATQSALISAVHSQADQDSRVETQMTVNTFPNPLHWHFDRVAVDDPAIGPVFDALSTSWRLPLDGGSMAHDWSAL